MSAPIVSFCIATFQRYEVLYELIQEILSVQTDKIEVVVCDDKSLDDSIERLRKIEDYRLKIYVNEENAGSSLNIHEALNKGKGNYLFYVNDRDNVDEFKIKKLIDILEEFDKEDVAFAKCTVNWGNRTEKYHIYKEGEESLLQFACRIDHPTGYIFKRKYWEKISNRRLLFENQKFGDFPITQICAIMAENYKGAWIYGDICDVKRLRIDFSKVKSGYYNKRRDKRLWYSPEVIVRELKIGQRFLKRLEIQSDIRRQVLINRYIEYLPWCITNYKNMIADPSCTVHYNLNPRQDFFHVFFISILNGFKLWSKISFFVFNDRKEVCPAINKATRQEYAEFFKSVWKSKFGRQGKCARDCEKKELEIYKRERVLGVYETWFDAVITHKMVSEYLFENGYHHVALYGMGRVGENLFKEFQDSNICVDYIIDRDKSIHKRYQEIVPCFDMDSELSYVDIIIVTLPAEAEKIIHELRKKVKWKIKSINDILFVM